MYTIVFFTRRLEGLSADEFVEHYRGKHYSLAIRMPGLISYQQSLVDAGTGPWPVATEVAGYEAISLYTFSSAEAATAAFASPEGLATDADSATFMLWDRILAAPGTVIQRYDAPLHPDERTSHDAQ